MGPNVLIYRVLILNLMSFVYIWNMFDKFISYHCIKIRNLASLYIPFIWSFENDRVFEKSQNYFFLESSASIVDCLLYMLLSHNLGKYCVI